MVLIVIPGEPVGKGRPRVGKRGKHVVMFTPEKTKSYEEMVKSEARSTMGSIDPLSGPVALSLELNFSVPASYPKGKSAKCLSGEVRPTKKPDLDNVVKAICDAFNEVVWVDDVQVVELQVSKRYSETPCVVARVEQINTGLDLQQAPQ